MLALIYKRIPNNRPILLNVFHPFFRKKMFEGNTGKVETFEVKVIGLFKE